MLSLPLAKPLGMSHELFDLKRSMIVCSDKVMHCVERDTVRAEWHGTRATEVLYVNAWMGRTESS
jgi:hypothetical protein